MFWINVCQKNLIFRNRWFSIIMIYTIHHTFSQLILTDGTGKKKWKYEINSSNYVVVPVKTKFAHNIMSSYNSWEILGFIHAFEKYSQGFRALAIWILLKFVDLFCFNHTIPFPSLTSDSGTAGIVNSMFYRALFFKVLMMSLLTFPGRVMRKLRLSRKTKLDINFLIFLWNILS